MADLMADLPPSIEHRCLEYGYMKLGRSTPPVEASSGKEWQFKISIVKAHIGRSSGRSTPEYCNALWDVYYGMYLAAILDCSRKGGEFAFMCE